MAAPKYHAPRWLTNPHLQTIYGSVFAAKPEVHYRRERWETPDGDFIDVDHVDGAAGHTWVVLFHGLEGSSDSAYARMLMHRVRERGWRGAVVNFRGCSGEPNRLSRAYHSGDAPEIDWIMRRLRAQNAAAPLFAAGVSLGGNALLKWLGDCGDSAAPLVNAAVAISVPLDLMATGNALGQGFNLVYTRNFLATLRAMSLEKLERFPGLYDADAVRASRTLREFDDLVTAPLHGFKNADDYWTRASSKPGLRNIRVPTLVLNARNDPLVPASALPGAGDVSAAVTLERPEQGGHAGFVSGRFPGNLDWLPARVLEFLRAR
jgi:uncharacterized protein